ncbi:MAG: hypothetical protein ACK5JT_13985 [Hyphomicrobiaceae bacterium]
MGDRGDARRKVRGPRALWLRAQRPPALNVDGLVIGSPAGIGHNNGPPLDRPVNDAFVRYRWRRAHAEVWKNPPMSILRFRVARAKAAGVTYEEYVSALLHTGRHMQAGDSGKNKK